MIARSTCFVSALLCLSACTGKTTGNSSTNAAVGGRTGSAASAGSHAGAGGSQPKSAGQGGSMVSSMPDAHVPMDAQPDAHADLDASQHRDAGDVDDAGSRPRDASTALDAAADSGSAPVRSLSCPNGTSYGGPLPSDRASTLVKTDFGFIEGPVWDAKLGVLLFSDMDMSTAQDAHGPNSQIRRFKPPSTFDVLVPSSGSNGMAIDRDGRLLAATHDIQSLSYFDPIAGTRQSLSLTYQGKHFNSPNDVAARSDGNIYFTDPDWQLG
ncbi:MAG TPA: SMP-30/gluconolactonase/LRE family protein, partial [Polyangiales bacterium]